MNPLPFVTLKFVLIAALVGAAGGFFALWRDESLAFAKYKAEVELIAKQQEESAKAIEERNNQITKDAQEQYEKRIADIRSYYAGRLRINTSRSGEMPGISKPPASIDAIPADALPIAAECAETTVQLIDLQHWVSQVSKVKE